MKNLYTKLIAIGIITEVALIIFFDKKIAAYGPVIFWAIGLFGIINYAVNIFKLSDSVKKTKPELFKTHSIGIMITRNALLDKHFLGVLNEDELRIIEKNKTIFPFLFLSFLLFVLSGIIIVLK